jgi:hypothetical protein
MFAMGVMLLGCSVPSEIPSRDKAVAFVEHLYPLAEAGQFEALCANGGGNCQTVLDDAGRDAVPNERPKIVDSFAIPSSDTADGTRVGGLVLVLCGTDGLDRPFRTEMLIFRDGATLRAIEPVYWSGMAVSGGNLTNAKPSATAC